MQINIYNVIETLKSIKSILVFKIISHAVGVKIYSITTLTNNISANSLKINLLMLLYYLLNLTLFPVAMYSSRISLALFSLLFANIVVNTSNIANA